MTELIGEGFILDAAELIRLEEFKSDKSVLSRLREIKLANKEDFAADVLRKTGIKLDTSSIFDVQVKRLHEYKRQHLNALEILAQYLSIKENPQDDYVPHAYIFSAAKGVLRDILLLSV